MLFSDPFDGPVVPDVKTTAWTSQGWIGRSRTGAVASPFVRASGVVSGGPTDATTSARSGATTMVFISLNATMCASSEPFMATLIGTTVAPRHWAPHHAPRKSGPFGSMIPTLSPCPTPRARNALAAR